MRLTLAHPILLLHIRLTEVAVEGAAPGAVVLPLDRQAVASRQANYSPPGAQGRPIAAGMHQPAAQQTHQGTEPWAVMTGLHTSRQRAQVLVEQQKDISRCSRCSITSGVIGVNSIT